MIVGIGTDIIEIDRVIKSCENKRFLQKYFSEKEILLIEKKTSICASNFCVKESFVKALGTGFRNIDAKDIEVLRDNLGAPYINLIGNLKDLFDDSVVNIFVTISHSNKYVTSTVIIER